MNNYDELYHYGIKGMKWGVRKKRKNSTRKIAKLKKYRDNELNYYSRVAKNEKKEAEWYKNQVDLLKKEGSKGIAMKDRYYTTDDDDAKKIYGQTMDELWKTTIWQYNHDREIAIARGEAFARKEQALMNIDLTTSSKKDIKRAGLNEVEVQNEELKRKIIGGAAFVASIGIIGSNIYKNSKLE